MLETESIFDTKVFVKIMEDLPSANTAVNSGIPMVIGAPKTVVVKDFQNLASFLIGKQPPKKKNELSDQTQPRATLQWVELERATISRHQTGIHPRTARLGVWRGIFDVAIRSDRGLAIASHLFHEFVPVASRSRAGRVVSAGSTHAVPPALDW